MRRIALPWAVLLVPVAAFTVSSFSSNRPNRIVRLFEQPDAADIKTTKPQADLLLESSRKPTKTVITEANKEDVPTDLKPKVEAQKNPTASRATEPHKKSTEQLPTDVNGGEAMDDEEWIEPVEEFVPLPVKALVDDQEMARDEKFMAMAVELAQSAGGERGPASAYPNPTVGAVLVANDGNVLGKGRSDYNTDAVRAALEDAGLDVVPLSEWLVAWPSSSQLRQALASATLYVTLEPSHERRGKALPPITSLIHQSGIARVVIGCADPMPERATKGATTLHASGLDVTLGGVLQDECEATLQVYSALAKSKLRHMARKHFQYFARPLGFLHCSVVDSDNLEAFARHGNAFGTNFGGTTLSFRDFGSYEIAPPPEMVWAMNDDDDDDFETEVDEMYSVDFEEENFQNSMPRSPMMPWYEQADAVVATFPHSGNGPANDDSITARLNSLRWLATHGRSLPAGVERILVIDATDLKDLPLTNDDPNLPPHLDVESFWAAKGRKPTRVLLRRGLNAQARAAAEAAAVAAAAAAKAAQAAMAAIESGDAARAAEAAIEFQQSALAETRFIQEELQQIQSLRSELEKRGVIVETLHGGEPVDVMKHLGERNGMQVVVWRAGCWGERGVKSILAGAFQWVSAHLAVDATGGKFWQLMLAESAVQAACGPERKVKVFADQEDISLEYCDDADADSDCTLTIDGRPVRHIRLDCRVALVNEDRPREFVIAKTQKLDRKIIEEEAPWFL